jgi:signal transduction histidine kinase/ActR/RegA family two-component response regulator
MFDSAAPLPETTAPAANRADSLLEAQRDVLEMIVRARPLREVLDALCKIVETYSETPVKAAILSGGLGNRASTPLKSPSGSTPIVSSTGHVLGQFETYFPEGREPRPQEQRLVEVLARTAALAMERERNDSLLLANARRDRFLTALSAVTQSITEPAAVMAATAQLLGEHLDVDRCAYAEVENESVFVITGDYPRGVPSIVGRWDVAAFGASCVQKMLSGEAFIVNDTQTDPQISAEDMPAYVATNIRAVICVPLLKDESFTAAMAVHQIVPREWTEGEVELVRLVVGRCWEALERSRIARNLRNTNAQLREQDRRKDEFLATLAHELRNPLAPIQTGLEILRAGAAAAEATKVHDMMQRQLQHLVRLVDDLLDVSRVTLGKILLKKQRIDFRGVLNMALETTRPLIEARGHELAVRLAQQDFPLEVDPTRMAQVLANIIGNAAKYTPTGGRILITAERSQRLLVVRVSDTGTGIPADMLSRVFDLFTQVRRTADSSQGGLGLGLTLVRRLVEMHDGTVFAESPGVGQGSTFVVRLPLDSSENSAALEGGRESRHPMTNPLKILVVDDNVDAAETLSMLFGIDGHDTRMVHDGASALKAIPEFTPDIAFVDIGLPDMNGYELAQRARALDGPVPSPVLVALTGWGADEDRRKAFAAGFDAHLVKPVDLEKINEALLLTRRSKT